MGSYELKTSQKTEPLGLWSVRACDTEGNKACVDLQDLYRLEGNFEGLLRETSSSKTYSYIPQRQASDEAYMKEHVMKNQSCLNMDPCDQYVKNLCCDTSVKSESTDNAMNIKDGWFAMLIMLMVLLGLALFVFAGIAYYATTHRV